MCRNKKILQSWKFGETFSIHLKTGRLGAILLVKEAASGRQANILYPLGAYQTKNILHTAL